MIEKKRVKKKKTIKITEKYIAKLMKTIYT